MTAVGIIRLLHSHVDGYRWFKRAVLVSIFFDAFIEFYWDQLRAVGGLVLDPFVLGGLNPALEEEAV